MNFRLYSAILAFLLLFYSEKAEAKCVGRFVNPITDICWSCIFPMTIGGVPVVKGEDTPNPSKLICACLRPPAPLPIPGIPVSFWEPARLAEVTRTPFCMVSLGGLSLGGGGIRSRGAVGNNSSGTATRHSFYHAHWYVYPLIYWLELLTDFICVEKATFDVAYMTELDPLWNDDELGFILNPEAALFGNPIAQAACAVDCGLSSVGFGQDSLFWCAGCQGSLYPFSGSVSHHVGGVSASLLIAQRMAAKLHRQGLLWGYAGIEGNCQKYPMPIMRKTQYKTQMVYPIPSTIKGCHPLGRTESLWAMGKEFPYSGEDFVYLIWRKRNCCVL